MENQVEAWLRRYYGLRFNPFEPLQAEKDFRLWMYWVGNEEAFKLAWEPGVSILLAPWGGGKSALRVRLTQECWTSPADRRPFPLVYFPDGPHMEIERHVQDLAAHGTRELLLALGRYPRRFLESSPRIQQGFARFLSQVRHALPLPPLTLLMEMEEEVSLAPLNRPFDPGYDLEIPREEREDLYRFCSTLRRFLSEDEGALTPAEHWEGLLFWIQEFLHRPAVYVLVDGLDAWPETSWDMKFLLDSLIPLLDQAPVWSKKDCYLKAFLPSAALPIIQERALPSEVQVGEISWSRLLLSHMLQRRMIAASRGEMDGLAALAEPSLADLDGRLIQTVKPLPRELLVLVDRILEAHADKQIPRLRRESVERAIDEYQTENVDA
jgi:hypothetical protein